MGAVAKHPSYINIVGEKLYNYFKDSGKNVHITAESYDSNNLIYKYYKHTERIPR